jgi:drug/metabolite transporter (DMT)-like permease
LGERINRIPDARRENGAEVEGLAYLVLLVTVFCFLLWFHLLTMIGATAASAYHFLMPPLGMLFGWLLLGEHIAWPDLVGILPIALGIYLVTRTDSTDQKAYRGPR